MLFIKKRTKKYPGEDDFDNALHLFSGDYNAYTETETTLFFFG